MSEKLSSLADLAAAFGKEPIEKKNNNEQDGSLVYSTDKGRIKHAESKSTVTQSRSIQSSCQSALSARSETLHG